MVPRARFPALAAAFLAFGIADVSFAGPEGPPLGVSFFPLTHALWREVSVAQEHQVRAAVKDRQIHYEVRFLRSDGEELAETLGLLPLDRAPRFCESIGLHVDSDPGSSAPRHHSKRTRHVQQIPYLDPALYRFEPDRPRYPSPWAAIDPEKAPLRCEGMEEACGWFADRGFIFLMNIAQRDRSQRRRLGPHDARSSADPRSHGPRRAPESPRRRGRCRHHGGSGGLQRGDADGTASFLAAVAAWRTGQGPRHSSCAEPC